MTPRISIAVPAYNAGLYLAQALDSALAQTMTDWEMVIVDDGSSDDTAVVAKQYVQQDSRLRFVMQEHAGISAAGNRCLAEFNPDTQFATVLPADDIWQEDALEVMLAALEQDTDAVGAHGLARLIDGKGKPIREGEIEQKLSQRRGVEKRRVVYWPLDRPTTFENLIVANCVVIGASLVRHAVLRQVGCFDPAIRLCEDWDITLRVSRFGHLVFIPRVVISYRQHDTNISRDRADMWRWSLYVLRKTARSPENTPEQKRIIQAAARQFQKVALRKYLIFGRDSARKGELVAAIRHCGPVPLHFARYLLGVW